MDTPSRICHHTTPLFDMLLPAYDAHGRLYYPQYEDAPSARTVEVLPDRARKATTRSVCACIDDTFYSYSLRQKKQSSMVVKPHRPSLSATSSVPPPPALAPIPKWTGRAEGEKRGRSRKSVGKDIERSHSRDIAGLAPKPKEMTSAPRFHGVSGNDTQMLCTILLTIHLLQSEETLVSIVEAPFMTPPPSLDPATASDYSAFTDIVTPDSTHGLDSRPPSIVPSSFKTSKQFFSSTNTSTASLLSQTAPSPKKKFCRSALFPPVGEEEYPARGLCPHLQVLLMSREPRSKGTKGGLVSMSRSEKARNIRAWSPAVSPPIAVINEQDPVTAEIRSALDSVISLELRKDTSSVALASRVPSDPAHHAILRQPYQFISYFSFISSSAFKTFSNQSPIGPERKCECCAASNASVKMSCIDEWIEAPYSIRQFRPPARRRADGSMLRKWCLEWQMVTHGKVDCVKDRHESKAPLPRQKESWKRGKERWGCGCVDHGFD